MLEELNAQHKASYQSIYMGLSASNMEGPNSQSPNFTRPLPGKPRTMPISVRGQTYLS